MQNSDRSVSMIFREHMDANNWARRGIFPNFPEPLGRQDLTGHLHRPLRHFLNIISLTVLLPHLHQE